MRKLAMAFWVVGAFCAASAFAADTVQYGPPPAWVVPPLLPKDDGTMAEAPSKVLLRSHQVKFEPGGSELYTESFVRLQTPQGLQSLGNLALPWKPDSDVLTIHKLQLLRGNQIIDVIANGQKFEVLRRENNLEYAALDGILTAAIQPAGMEVGDILDIAFTVKRRSLPGMPPELALNGFTQIPISHVEVRATWDKAMPMRWRATPEVEGIVQSRVGSQVEVKWSADDLAPATQAKYAPARFWKDPRIEFSGYASWEAVSRMLAPVYTRAVELAADSPLREEARAIAASSTDPVARLEAVLKLAQERVRYVFLGMNDGGMIPAGASETWKRRFGDCKAKSALLIALLRELGIEAEPVAVNSGVGDLLADALPMLGAFDHVIVRARTGGKTYWLDGARVGSWQRAELALPNYFWGLPLSARGDALMPMIAAPAAEPGIETSTSIDARAGLHTDAPFTARCSFRGTPAALLNSSLAALIPGEREQALRRYWKAQYDFVDVKKVAAEYDARTGIATMTMEGTAAMEWGGYSYTTDGIRVGARADYSREDSMNQDAPFVLQHPAYTVSRQRIELPAVGSFTTRGKDYDLALAGMRYVRHSKIENRVFTGEASSLNQALHASGRPLSLGRSGRARSVLSASRTSPARAPVSGPYSSRSFCHSMPAVLWIA